MNNETWGHWGMGHGAWGMGHGAWGMGMKYEEICNVRMKKEEGGERIQDRRMRYII